LVEGNRNRPLAEAQVPTNRDHHCLDIAAAVEDQSLMSPIMAPLLLL
jgi:hypothetical protein